MHNKNVYRIEDLKMENLGTVIVAAGWQFIEEIIRDLGQYNVGSLNVISPLLFDSWPMDIIKTKGCKISPNAAVAEDAQIFADDTSEILIESGVIIHSKVRILASQGSRIIVKSNTQLQQCAFIFAENGTVTIGAYSYLSEKATLSAQNNSSIRLGNKVSLAEKAFIRIDRDASVRVNRNLTLGESASIQASKNASIQIDYRASLGKDSCVSAHKKSTVQIGHHISVGNNTNIVASDKGTIKLGNRVGIGKNTTFAAYYQGILSLGDSSCIGDSTTCNSINHAIVNLGSGIRLANCGSLGGDHGIVTVGNSTTINPHFYIGCTHSKIEIGEDNMFSFFVKMNAGSHEIIDKNTGGVIDNTMPIVTEKHVWLGMGTTLLPGCHIGEGTIIGACALVNKPLPVHSICVGIPVKIIRSNIEWNREKRHSHSQ